MNKWIKNTTAILCLGFATQAMAKNCTEVRAGIDMGSGTTKILVSEVNVCTKTLGKVLFAQEKPIGFNEDLAKSANNQLSPEIQQQGVTTLKALVGQAQKFHPVRITGVATAVFRTAANGPQVIKQFNHQAHVSLRVISQKQEAEQGFLSAKAALNDPTVKDTDLLVWDIGGGSMQMTTYNRINGIKTPEIYQGKLASVSLKDMVIEVMMNKDLKQVSSPNPVGPLAGEILRWVKFYARTHVNPQIMQAAGSKKVVGIGGVHGYSIKDQLHPINNQYSAADLERVALVKTTQSDAQLSGDYRATDVTNLLLVEGFMQALNISDVTIVKASLIQGILLQ
ncbi:phosphatase [Rouxiella sp. S1S-2]|uniref:Ppx/GppA phosphatase family protein n=1 Tax=Rouxiella sp. S1S-2 TaxID=2653856 RepID=UPI0012652171|nr:phosphatase [Rouxiella sp. S1S-2]KAB7897986.1 phosphatase [Rouxiella sp. S1S-2]